MLASDFSTRTGVDWDVVSSSAPLDTAPGFGNLGRSFLIENLLRVRDDSPRCLLIPPLARSGAATADPGAQALEYPPSGSPGPLQLCPAGEHIASPRTLWPFQTLRPSTDSNQLPGQNRGDQGGPFHPAAPGEETMLPLLTEDSNFKLQRGILRRAVFSDDQRKSLEKMFQKQKYINKIDRKKLSINLGLKESQVKIWFQNRRTKWRNCKEKEVFSNHYIKEEGFQENQISRSLCPRIWKVS